MLGNLRGCLCWQCPALFRMIDLTSRVFVAYNKVGEYGSAYLVWSSVSPSSWLRSGLIHALFICTEFIQNVPSLDPTALSMCLSPWCRFVISLSTYKGVTVSIAINLINILCHKKWKTKVSLRFHAVLTHLSSKIEALTTSSMTDTRTNHRRLTIRRPRWKSKLWGRSGQPIKNQTLYRKQLRQKKEVKRLSDLSGSGIEKITNLLSGCQRAGILIRKWTRGCCTKSCSTNI